jgi:hypothetical protein
MKERCVVSISLIEREGSDEENRIEKTVCFESDFLTVDDVLLAMTESLRGFGFVIGEKNLRLLEDN